MGSMTTVMPFVLGAAIGATGMYLLDPEHGPQRRTRARAQLTATARQGATGAVQTARRGSSLARQAMQRTPGTRTNPAT
jgi:hypothetical protein